jgi:3-oxoacyl-[acyl-carrier-protein] synthase-1
MRLDLVGSGMVTAVGYTAASSCAAIRAHIDGFQRTRFEFDGDFVQAAPVPLDVAPLQEKLATMAVAAIDQCMQVVPGDDAQDTAIALCLAETDRPGRLSGLDERFAAVLRARAERAARFGPHVRLFFGPLGAIEALLWADEVLGAFAARQCVVVGVDTLMTPETLTALHAAGKLLTATNSDGFIPGEAAAALVVARTTDAPVALECRGIGWGLERALPGSGKPLRGDGLALAYRAALKAASCGFEAVDYRLTDVAGDQFAFKEAALGLLRTMRVRKKAFELWHPADCVGNVGAAAPLVVLGVALAAARKSYAPGPGVLCHFSDDTGRRAAVVLGTRDRRGAESLAKWWGT